MESELFSLHTISVISIGYNILLTKITTAQNEVTLRYYRVRGLYFLAVIFVATVLPLLTNRVFDNVILCATLLIICIFDSN